MFLEIPLASPYSTTPGAVPASLLAGQIGVNLPDRRIFAGGEDGLPRVIYDPVAPQTISLSNSQPGLTLQSGNATGGMSDTVPVQRIGGASGVDGWDWRYLTNGDLRLVRRVAGVETVLLHAQRTGGIALGGAPGSEAFRAQTGANWVNRILAVGGIAGASPTLIANGSDADVGFNWQMKGAGTLAVNTLQGGLYLRQVLNIHAPDGLTDYFQIDGGDATGPVTLSARSGVNANATLRLLGQGTGGVRIDGPIGFGVAPIARQTITGSRSDGTALANLLAALALRGDVTDATTV